MPVFRSGKGNAPAWCELEYFDIVEVPAGGSHRFGRIGAKEKLIVGNGACRILAAGEAVDAETGTQVDLRSPEGCFEVRDVTGDATLIRMCGRWGDETGGSGLFSVATPDNRTDRGDAVDYPKETAFDNHYHDCDEYWIVFAGRGIAVSEGKSFEVGPGDCVATGMGHHHDFPQVSEPVRCVFFETTKEGEKRHGHLWNHEHGLAQPRPERV